MTADADTDEITEALVNLTAENDRLRGEVERITRMEEEMDEMAVRVAQVGLLCIVEIGKGNRITIFH